MKITEKVKIKIPGLFYLHIMIKWCEENLEEKQELDMIIAFIAEKFKFEELKDFSFMTLTKLNTFIWKLGIVNSDLIDEPIFELTESGIISLIKSWLRYRYDDIIIDRRYTILLNINGNEYESKYMDDKQIEAFKQKLLVLFDKEVFRNAKPIDKVEALYDIFKSPRMSNYLKGYNAMVAAINNLETFENTREYKTTAYNKVINLYLQYLWEADGNGKDLKFVYSFDSWVEKHKDLWGEDISPPKETLNLFMEEHKEVLDIFVNIKEPDIVWRKGKEKLSSERLLLEIIINGLGGTSKTM